MNAKDDFEPESNLAAAPDGLRVVSSLARWAVEKLFPGLARIEGGGGIVDVCAQLFAPASRSGRLFDACYTFSQNGVYGDLVDISPSSHKWRHVSMAVSNADLILLGGAVANWPQRQILEDCTRASLAGIRHCVIVVIDEDVSGAARRFEALSAQIRKHCEKLEFETPVVIPLGSLQEKEVFGGALRTIFQQRKGRDKTRVEPVQSGGGVKSDQFAAYFFGVAGKPVLPGRPYTLILAGQEATASISTLKHRFELETAGHLASTHIQAGEIAYGNLSLDKPVSFQPFDDNHNSGCGLLIDKISGEPAALVTIRFDLWRSSNVHWQQLDIDKKARAGLKQQTPVVLWFTGLSGSGKSTIANLLEKKLYAMGRHTCLLDGDNVRHGLCRDLGFTDVDRVENIRRVAETAKLMLDAGLIVVTAFISPFCDERRMARKLIGEGEFIEIFVDAPLDVCEERDPKGLYKKARAGLIRNFTGLDSPYEKPERCDIRLDADKYTAVELLEQLLEVLEQRSLI